MLRTCDKCAILTLATQATKPAGEIVFQTISLSAKENETWKSADKFISMSASIGAQVVSHTIIYWIIGIILSLVSFAFFYFIISSQLGI
jgi:hypothetical protein